MSPFSRFFLKKQRNPLHRVATYTIYYDYVTEDELSQLSGYDMVIIEPHHFTTAMVQRLQTAGTLVYGYMSVMETPSWNEQRTSSLKPDDFFMVNKEPVHFPLWDSWLMDLRQAHYRELLHKEIDEQIVGKQMDGLFLDTVGDIDEYIPPDEKLRRSMKKAYRSLLRRTLSHYPSLSIIQNRGFDALPFSHVYLDGLLWEDWHGDLLGNEWRQKTLLHAVKYQKKRLRIFTVSSSNDPIHKREAHQLGFVHLVCPRGYHQL